ADGRTCSARMGVAGSSLPQPGSKPATRPARRAAPAGSHDLGRPDVVPSEAAYFDLLAERRTGLVEHRLDGDLAVTYPRLVEQCDVLLVAVQFPLDDLGDGLVVLALFASGGLVDLGLLLEDLVRDLV
nr:hypothetical protein [Micromonospora sp. DSM 115978]